MHHGAHALTALASLHVFAVIALTGLLAITLWGAHRVLGLQPVGSGVPSKRLPFPTARKGYKSVLENIA